MPSNCFLHATYVNEVCRPASADPEVRFAHVPSACGLLRQPSRGTASHFMTYDEWMEDGARAITDTVISSAEDVETIIHDAHL